MRGWDDIEAEQETALTMSSMLAGRWAFSKFSGFNVAPVGLPVIAASLAAKE